MWGQGGGGEPCVYLEHSFQEEITEQQDFAVLVRVLQGNRTSKVETCVYQEIDYEELAHGYKG